MVNAHEWTKNGKRCRVEFSYSEAPEKVKHDLDGDIIEREEIITRQHITLVIDGKTVVENDYYLFVDEQNKTLFAADVPVGTLVIGNKIIKSDEVAAIAAMIEKTKAEGGYVAPAPDAKVEAAKAEARLTGKNILVRVYHDAECSEKDLDCDFDTIFEYVTPDGSFVHERKHNF